MIKEAIQYIVGLGNTRLESINGQEYSTQKMHLIEEATPNALEVKNLTGIVDYLKSGFDEDDYTKRMIQIISPTEVVVYSTFNQDYQRNEYMKARAMIPQYDFDRWYDAENFNIKLQSTFVKNDDRDIMLQVVGNIKEEAVNTVGDDGISQTVVAKTGVASVGNVRVPNPVVLKPYRTFIEVDQPESEFIFRMQSGPRCALFEADGGAWKSVAMKNIKEFLEDQLQEEIQSDKIVIIA